MNNGGWQGWCFGDGVVVVVVIVISGSHFLFGFFFLPAKEGAGRVSVSRTVAFMVSTFHPVRVPQWSRGSGV